MHGEALDDAIAANENQSVNPGVTENGSPSPSTIGESEHQLVFSDEFNGDSLDVTRWDTSVWNPDTIIFNQLQYYVDTQNGNELFASPFSFNGQHLTISATSTPDEQLAAANGQAYLSGILSTRETFEFTYGYVEARIKVQSGRGIWPSLWMLGSDTSGLSPEIYLFEFDGSIPDSVFHNYIYQDTEGNRRSHEQQEVLISGFSEQFRTIGLRWSPDELLYYVDGQPTYRVIGDNVPSEDMLLILNLAMGGERVGAPDATTPDPATLVVDYIRVYQEQPSS